MTLAVGIVLAVAVVAAATVQGVVGFGFALFVAPITAAVLDPRSAVVVVTLLGSIVPACIASTERHHIEVGPARRIVAGVLVGTPLGLVVLLNLPERGLKLTIAGAVLVAVAVLWRGVRIVDARPSFDLGAGIISGALATSTGTNGPPVVLALQARHLPPDRFRATSTTCTLAANLVTAALLASSGQITLRLATFCLIGAPLVLAGWRIGLRSRRRLQPDSFRNAVLGLLSLSALIAAVSAL